MPTLRQAAKDDITLIHELACQAFPATYRDLLSREQIDFMMDWMYSPANLEKQMEEGHVYFIASHEGKDCGYLSVQPEGPGACAENHGVRGCWGFRAAYRFRQPALWRAAADPQ